MSNLKIGEAMRLFFVENLTHELRNPSGDWRDYQDAVDRWNYLNDIAQSNQPFLKPEDVPSFPDVDDYPLID